MLTNDELGLEKLRAASLVFGRSSGLTARARDGCVFHVA